jgi:hypothetical protein
MATEKKFKFNLITPITKEEIKTIEERDNTLVNSFILIFAAVFVFSGLTLINALLIAPAVANTSTALKNKETALNRFTPVKLLNGEFVVKANALSPLLELDIKPAKLVEIVDKLVSDLSTELDIDSFGRDKTGDFVVQAYIADLDSITLIKDFFEQNEEDVDNLFFSQVSNTKGQLYVSISFDIIV